MKYRVKPTKQFKKDLKRLKKSNADVAQLEQVITKLQHNETLAPVFKDHALKGSLRGQRVCHIGPDWLLCYVKEEAELRLLLLTTGTHRHTLHIE